ncbi:hypothetical protein SmJEL517_g02295 [Synchytrium microbalum]|uniref:Autophagy-related protein 101 n=1 Tax=Synchytrium microbalum TaxID=1806994 RepID=A0A507C7W7_9FUNG|nr:uncharacterized protein SmJEL517_g02295 [Synchytrium microbalum]TPX35239.1 hypothetical protein SmJEL517_g02295 [Synchytrium microbalum]
MPDPYRLELNVDRFYLKEVLRALLHSIIYHRSFSMTRPYEVNLEALDIRLDDPEIEGQVDEKISTFARTLDSYTGLVKGQIDVMFFEKRAKKYWFTKAEEEVCWEQWTLAVNVTLARSEREQIESRKALERQLLNCLFKISGKTNEEKDHIPPITNQDTYPFPFQIVTTSASETSWTSVLKSYLPS